FNVTAKLTDGAGNSSANSSNFSVTVDTASPSAPSLALATDSGSSNSDQTTNNGTVNVSGLEAGATWQYSIDGGTNWTTGSGSSFTLAGDGAKSVIVRQTDSAGNVSADSGAFSFTLDTTADGGADLALSIGDTTINAAEKGAVAFTASGIDPDATSATVTFSDGTHSVTVNAAAGVADLSGLDDGPVSSQLTVTDGAGNTASANGAAITLDATAPSAPGLALATDSGSSKSDRSTNKGPVNVSGLEAGATWQYSIDNGANWTTGSGASFTLAGDGAKSVIVRQTDSAGNVSPASAPFGFTLDTTGPSETISSTIVTDSGQTPTIGFAGVTSDNTLGLSGTVDDNLASVDVYYNGGTLLGSATVDSGTWRFTTAPLADGNYSFAIEVTDAAGNMTYTSAVPATVDTTASAPSLSLATDSGSSNSDRITNNGTVNVSGLEAGATWQYSIDGGTNWTAGSGASFTLA